MQFSKVNGVNIHYQVIGAPEGSPLLVFSNSLGTDFRIWRDVIVRFVGECAILTYDKRGHGLSELGETPYKMSDHIDDLEALLDELGQKQAIIVGLSVGGLIAQGLYEKRPDLVRAMVLCDTAHKIGDDTLWNDRIAAVSEGGIESLADGIMQRWFSKEYPLEQAAAYDGYRAMLSRQLDAGYAATCAAIRDADYTEATANIKIPTMCVVGDQDGATPPSLVAELAKLIPDARFEVIKNAGHLPCIEQPEMLAEMIKAFFDDAGLWPKK
ncbi:MAG: 3-oxoadipate enol-lactonase [Hyphomicrobiales bacterium]